MDVIALLKKTIQTYSTVCVSGHMYRCLGERLNVKCTQAFSSYKGTCTAAGACLLTLKCPLCYVCYTVCCKERNSLSGSLKSSKGQRSVQEIQESGSSVFSHVSNRVRGDEKQPSARVIVLHWWINTRMRRQP